MSQHIDIFLAIIEAWKRKDIDAVLAHMSDDIVWHFAASVEPPIVGKASARKFLKRFGAEIAEVRWRVFHHAQSGDRLFVEGVDEYVTPQGQVIAAPYAGVLEFAGDLVCGWRDYVDVGVVAAQKAGKPLTPQVLQLMDRAAVTPKSA
jgi:limonene-1,2-epoxide hydrolase